MHVKKKKGCKSLVIYLIEHEADINTKMIIRIEHRYLVPYKKGHDALVEFVMVYGADVNKNGYLWLNYNIFMQNFRM